MATVFFKGSAELATLTNTFEVVGSPSDPTAVTLTVTDPTGTATSYSYGLGEITRTGQGVYTKDVACTVAGIWTYTWIGTGAAADVQAGTWTVFSTELNKLYCSVEELTSRFGGLPDGNDDFELRMAADSASRWIDGYCDRYFWRGTDTRTFQPQSLYHVEVDDLVSVTSLACDAGGDGGFETTWSATDYQLLPVHPLVGGEDGPYTSIKAVGTQTFPSIFAAPLRYDRVQITGVFGWPAVPAAVKHAALILASDLFKLKDAPFGVAGYGDYGPMRVRDNPKVASLLVPYRRCPVLMA